MRLFRFIYRTLVWEVLPSADVHSVYSTALADWIMSMCVCTYVRMSVCVPMCISGRVSLDILTYAFSHTNTHTDTEEKKPCIYIHVYYVILWEEERNKEKERDSLNAYLNYPVMDIVSFFSLVLVFSVRAQIQVNVSKQIFASKFAVFKVLL